ncbi:hypothetical protein D3C83_279120 [compost metagenome]
MITPIMEKMLSVLPASHSPPKAPTTDSGKDSMMLSGWMKLSNCAARIMYTSTIARKSAMPM